MRAHGRGGLSGQVTETWWHLWPPSRAEGPGCDLLLHLVFWPQSWTPESHCLALGSESGAQCSQVRAVRSFRPPAAQPRGFLGHGARMGRDGGRPLLRPRALGAPAAWALRGLLTVSRWFVGGSRGQRGPAGCVPQPVAGALTVRWQDVVVEAGPLAEAPGLTPSLRAPPSRSACLALQGGRGGEGSACQHCEDGRCLWRI